MGIERDMLAMIRGKRVPREMTMPSSSPSPPPDVDEFAILTEDGQEILTEAGDVIQVEH